MLSGPPQFIWSLLCGDIPTLEERTRSPSSHFFTMVSLQPWVILGFQLPNPVNTNGCRSSLNWVPDSAHTGVLVIKWVRMFYLSLLFWQLKKLKNHDFQLPRNLVHVTEYPIGWLDFEGRVDGAGQRKRTLNMEVGF